MAFNRMMLNSFTESCTIDADLSYESELNPCAALDQTTGWKEVLGVEYEGDARIIDPEIELTDSTKQEFIINLV